MITGFVVFVKFAESYSIGKGQTERDIAKLGAEKFHLLNNIYS